MAEKISNEKLKAEVVRFIEVANQKFDGLTADIRTNSFKIDRVESSVNQLREKLDSVASDVRVFSGQFTDIGGLV